MGTTPSIACQISGASATKVQQRKQKRRKMSPNKFKKNSHCGGCVIVVKQNF
jgi:hypothetical protein